MLEILGMILADFAKKLSIRDVVDVVKDVDQWRRQRKMADIGASMFQLYMAAEEIVEKGHGILGHLEFMVRKHRDQVFKDDYIAPTLEREGAKLTRAMDQQVAIIHSFDALYEKLRRQIEVIDAGAARDFYNLTSGKTRLLELLIGRSGETGESVGRYFSLDLPEIQDALRQELDCFSESTETARRSYRIGAALESGLQKHNAMVIAVPWSRSTFEVLQLYVHSGLGKRRLTALHDAAQRFRETLEKNFDLHDVLLAIERHRVPDVSNDTGT
jgi:hypothetical protein